VKDLERIAQFDAVRSAEEKKVLRGMSAFYYYE